MRISDWSSDVCSSDLGEQIFGQTEQVAAIARQLDAAAFEPGETGATLRQHLLRHEVDRDQPRGHLVGLRDRHAIGRSEEHTSELQSLMRNSYAVFCLQKNTTHHSRNTIPQYTDRNNTTIT